MNNNEKSEIQTKQKNVNIDLLLLKNTQQLKFRTKSVHKQQSKKIRKKLGQTEIK